MLHGYELVKSQEGQGEENEREYSYDNNSLLSAAPSSSETSSDLTSSPTSISNHSPSSSSPSTSSSLTPLTTYITIIKCAVGGGSFSLPYAFQLGGVYASFLFTLLLGYLCFYTIDLLSYCQQKFLLISNRENSTQKKSLTYSQMGSVAFPRSFLHVSSTTTKINLISLLINVGIFLTCIGVCVAYIDIITSIYPTILNPHNHSIIQNSNITNTSNLSQSPSQSPTTQHSYFDHLSPSSPLAHWLLLPFLIPLSLISNYRYLITTSTIGSLAVYLGLLLVIFNGFQSTSSSSSSSSGELSFSQPFIQFKSFNQFISRTCFLFAIHIVILPIAQEMSPSSYSSFHRVLFYAYSTISISNSLFGLIVSLLYSSSTCPTSSTLFSHGPCPNILDSLSGGLLIHVVKALICIDLLFSIPLILSSPREQLLSLLSLLSSSSPSSLPALSPSTHSLIIRILLPFFLLMISSLIPDFGIAVDFVGGVCNSLMGFVLPPLFVLTLHSREEWKNLPLLCQKGTLRWYFYVAWNVVIIGFGVYLMILTTYNSLNSGSHT